MTKFKKILSWQKTGKLSQKIKNVRGQVRNVRVKVITKLKRGSAYIVFVYTLSSPLAPLCQVVLPLIGVSPSIEKVRAIKKEQFFRDLDIGILNIPESKSFKVEFSQVSLEQRKQLEILAFQLQEGSISVDEAILKIRGGDFNESAKQVLGCLVAVFIISGAIKTPRVQEFLHKLKELFGTEAWASNSTPERNPYRLGGGANWKGGPDWGGRSFGDPKGTSRSPSYPSQYPSKYSSTKLAVMEKPSTMDQAAYAPLPTAGKSQLNDPKGRDRFIKRSGKPELDVLYNRVYFKCSDHGKLFNLPVNDKGKTPRSEQNVEIMRDCLVDMGMHEGSKVQWFENGGYQTNTPRGCEAINLYDFENDIIAVYRKREDGRNVLETTVKPTAKERQHFFASNGHFVTNFNLKDPNWQSPNPNWEEYGASNFPSSYQNYNPSSLSNPTSSLEGNSSSSANDGFTPINTFESDVMGITPTENPQDNP